MSSIGRCLSQGRGGGSPLHHAARSPSPLCGGGSV